MNMIKRIIQWKSSYTATLDQVYDGEFEEQVWVWKPFNNGTYRSYSFKCLHCCLFTTASTQTNWNFKEVNGKSTENYKMNWKIAFYYQKSRKYDELLIHEKKKNNPKNSYHSYTVWNSQGANSNATCMNCCGFFYFKKSLFLYFTDRRVTQQTFRTNLYNLFTGKEHIFSAKEISRFSQCFLPLASDLNHLCSL